MTMASVAGQSVLYHFCCAHAAPIIDRCGFLSPTPVSWRRMDELLARGGWPTTGLTQAPTVVWLTDLAEPDVEGLGLTRDTIECDRTEFRYTVSRLHAVSWDSFCRRYRPHAAYRDWLESGRSPAHWFVATANLPVIGRLDRRTGCQRRAWADGVLREVTP
jgi:hypothetical protein